MYFRLVSYNCRCYGIEGNVSKCIYSTMSLSDFTLLPRHTVSSTYHVVGKNGQQQFQLIRLDVDVGLDSVPWPDGPALKHLSIEHLDEIKLRQFVTSYSDNHQEPFLRCRWQFSYTGEQEDCQNWPDGFVVPAWWIKSQNENATQLFKRFTRKDVISTLLLSIKEMCDFFFFK